MSILNTFASKLFPEGNFQNIRANAPNQMSYNIDATRDLVQNQLFNPLAPAMAATFSLPYDTIQGIGRAFKNVKSEPGILDYDNIPNDITFADIGKSIAAENPIDSLLGRTYGATLGLGDKLKQLGGIFNTSAMASELAPTNSSAAMMFDRITDPNLMTVQNFRAIENEPFKEIPGFNFIDAPTSLMSRLQNPEFLNNPRRGVIDNILMQKGNPGNTIVDKAKSGFGKGINLGKAAIGGIASLVTGIPGIGLLLNALGPMTEEEKEMRDFYEDQFGLTDTGQVASGIMQGYNPVSMFGSAGLTNAIDKRMATIKNTLQKKKSVALENKLKELQRIKEAEQKAREDRARQIRSQIEQQYRDRPGQFGGPDRQTEREQAGPGYRDVSEAGSF